MDEANHLSSPAAAWALAAVALNTMSLQAGDILGVPRKQTFYYKVCPVFCILATFDSLFRLAKYSVEQRSIGEALTRWMDNRFDPTDQMPAKPIWSSSPIVIVFSIGILSQAVKIYATRNAVITQLLCTTYLANYVIDSLIITLASRIPGSTSGDIPRPLDDRRRQSLLTTTLEGVLMLMAFNIINHDPSFWGMRLIIFVLRHNSSAPLIFMLIVPLIFLTLGCSDLQPQINVKRILTWNCAYIGVVNASMLLSATVIRYSQKSLSREALVFYPGRLCFGVAALVPFALASMQFQITNIGRVGKVYRSSYWMECLMAYNLLFSHAFTAFFWYAYAHDPTVTSRPSWTNYIP